MTGTKHEPDTAMTPLAITFMITAAALALWGVVLLVQRLRLPGFAAQVYDSTTEKGLLDARIDRDSYIKAYTHSEGPRKGLWLWATSVMALITLPFIVSLVYTILDAIWDGLKIGLGPWALGQIMKDFFGFVTTMGIYGALLYLVTLTYYKRSPPQLSQEIERLKTEAGQ
ncbi:MAG: hypothetical protein AAGH90_07825 [Pseudomonadota bacterium]